MFNLKGKKYAIMTITILILLVLMSSSIFAKQSRLANRRQVIWIPQYRTYSLSYLKDQEYVKRNQYEKRVGQNRKVKWNLGKAYTDE